MLSAGRGPGSLKRGAVRVRDALSLVRKPLEIAMKRRLSAAFALVALSSSAAALANPVGSYDVVGRNPDSGSEYRGRVTVSRTGETYKVVWNIGGTRYVGTGLGAVMENGTFRIGAANSADTLISVGYVSGNSFGMAFYIEQDDGSWEGVWTYGGSGRVATEQWYRR